MSPNGVGENCDWVQKLNIVQPMNLPDIPDPLDYYNNSSARRCAVATVQWFNHAVGYKKRQRNNTPNKPTLRYGFTAHALRHAYNIRGHKLGVNQKMLADGLGHGLQMNSSTYMKHEQTNSKIQGLKQGIASHSQKQSEKEELRDENKYLKDENKYLKTEVEKLRAELAMYKALEQNQNNS